MHILIADDHPIFRSGLKFLLEASFDKLTLHEFENGETLLEYAKSNSADVIIVDIDMPIKNGLQVCEELTENKNPAKIIVLTMHKDLELLKLAFL